MSLETLISVMLIKNMHFRVLTQSKSLPILKLCFFILKS